MRAFLEKIKLPLEVTAIIVGLLVAIPAAWQLLRPKSQLVGELVLTEARLPGGLLRDAKALPASVERTLLADEKFKTLVVDESKRVAVAAQVSDAVDRHALSLHGFAGLRNSFMAVVVRNNGDKPLSAVKLGFRYALSQDITVIAPDGTSKSFESSGVVDLGELPPRAETKLYAWGLGNLVSTPSDVTLSSQEGIGEIQLWVAVPEILWGMRAFLSGLQQAFLAMIAFALFGIGIAGVVRNRNQRSAGAATARD